MKLVVLGGSELIGRKLISRLRHDGHDALAAAPGAGLSDALAGAQVVIDVTTPPFGDDALRNLLSAESAAGVAHHVAFFRAEVAQEEVVKAGPVPYTIVRATLLFEDIAGIVEPSGDRDTDRRSRVLVQPVAAADVAGALADVAAGTPLDDTIELAGPEAFALDARSLGAALDGDSLIPGDGARIAPTHFEDWLSQSN
jgi:uncharacterized protein YbjT (DUF2867 family)